MQQGLWNESLVSEYNMNYVGAVGATGFIMVRKDTTNMLGLQRGAVQLVPYTPAWATLFQAERARLQGALGADALDIQHIGSTAVPGLAAKPILDLGIAVAAEAVVATLVPRLAALGYTYHGYRWGRPGSFL